MHCLVRRMIVSISMMLLAATAVAQTRDNGATDVLNAIKPALEQAQKGGATVIIVGPGENDEADGEVAAQASIPDKLMRAKFRFGLAWQSHERAFANMSESLAKASPDGRLNWLLYAIIAGAVSVLLGRLLAKPIAVWVRNTFEPKVRDVPENRSEKIGYLLFRGFVFIAMATISGAIGTLLVVLYAGDHEPTQITGLAIVWTYTALRYARAIYMNFLVPSVPNYRVINMSDDDAGSIYRALFAGSTVSITILGLCLWMEALGLDQNTHKLALLGGSLSAALVLSAIAIVFRQPVAQAILGCGAPEDKPFWLRTLAKTWHVVIVAYLAFAWVVSAVRLLLDQPDSAGLVGAPLVALVLGLTVYGMVLIALDSYFDRQPTALPVQQPASAGMPPPDMDYYPDEPLESLPTEDTGPADEVDAGAVVVRTQRSIFKGLAEHAVALMIGIVGFFYITRVWGIDLSDQESWIADSLDIVIVVFMAYIAYRAVEIWVDAKREEEGDIDPEEPGGDPGGHGASRLVTLLPIFRNFLLITIVVMAGMIALSEIGVDIAPLFAGAGVVGLAIGFGAQTLIRDIFSGAFFLIDDAFRKGEYIDIGTAKGTVEKISIRSFQLRHHRGALNTVPFGEIKQLTNYSRDWVMMKLPIRVTYDTDMEKVRKLVKKLGQELLEHPDHGDKFLQPLKSQGVAQMEDSAMIMRLKFMTRPGDQFAIRTMVFTRIRELFEQEGIKFAHREVTVRVNDSGREPSQESLEAAAAAGIAATQSQKPSAS